MSLCPTGLRTCSHQPCLSPIAEPNDRGDLARFAPLVQVVAIVAFTRSPCNIQQLGVVQYVRRLLGALKGEEGRLSLIDSHSEKSQKTAPQAPPRQCGPKPSIKGKPRSSPSRSSSCSPVLSCHACMMIFCVILTLILQSRGPWSRLSPGYERIPAVVYY